MTKRARLGLMVGGVHYRQPGLWIKAATTLDVLSGGRAWLGIGAAWNEDESRSLGFAFPPLAERFELLEDTLRMAHGMWTGPRGTEAAFDGNHVHATRLLNSPPPLTRPHLPDHGRRWRRDQDPPARRPVRGREQRLRRPGDRPPQVRDPARPLRGGRPAVRGDRTVDPPERATSPAEGGRGPSAPARLVDRFGELADAGVQHIILSPHLIDPATLEAVGGAIIPQLRDL